MNPQDVTPKVHGFPGLPIWLDFPKIKVVAEYYHLTSVGAKKLLHDNPEIYSLIMTEKGNDATPTKHEPRTNDCIPVDKTALSTEPKDIS